MAARYWVGGSGNWSDTAHWSTTSGGGGGSAAPTSSDDVTLDANSGAAATVTIDAAANANTITINKSTCTLLHNFGSTVVGAVTLTNGTLNTNGQTCSWGSFDASVAGTKTISLGASAVTITAGGSDHNWNSTGYGLTANTATVTFTGAYAGMNGWGNMNGLSIVFTGGGGCTGSNGATGVKNFTYIPTNSKTNGVAFANLACTGTVTIGGQTIQGVNRLLVQAAYGVGTQRIITCAAVIITGDVDFMDIQVAYTGAASWTNAGAAFIGDCGNNGSVIAAHVTTSAPQTATGTASFTCSTHGWTSRVPLPQDDVSIPNAFVAGRTITSDMPRIGRSVTCTCTGSPTLSWSVEPTLYGGLALASGMTLSGSGTITFNGRTGTNAIWCHGVQLSGPVRINFSNTWTTFDLECTTARTITLPASGTQTVTNSLILTGAAGQVLSLVSSTPGTATTIQYNGFAAPVMSKYALSADIVMNSPRVQLPIQVGNLGGIGI